MAIFANFVAFHGSEVQGSTPPLVWKTASLINKETLKKRILQRRTSIEYRIMNIESSTGGQVLKEGILSILKKD